jgi:hypothetical protein
MLTFVLTDELATVLKKKIKNPVKCLLSKTFKGFHYLWELTGSNRRPSACKIFQNVFYPSKSATVAYCIKRAYSFRKQRVCHVNPGVNSQLPSWAWVELILRDWRNILYKLYNVGLYKFNCFLF